MLVDPNVQVLNNYFKKFS